MQSHHQPPGFYHYPPASCTTNAYPYNMNTNAYPYNMNTNAYPYNMNSQPGVPGQMTTAPNQVLPQQDSNLTYSSSLPSNTPYYPVPNPPNQFSTQPQQPWGSIGTAPAIPGAMNPGFPSSNPMPPSAPLYYPQQQQQLHQERKPFPESYLNRFPLALNNPNRLNGQPQYNNDFRSMYQPIFPNNAAAATPPAFQAPQNTNINKRQRLASIQKEMVVDNPQKQSNVLPAKMQQQKPQILPEHPATATPHPKPLNTIANKEEISTSKKDEVGAEPLATPRPKEISVDEKGNDSDSNDDFPLPLPVYQHTIDIAKAHSMGKELNLEDVALPLPVIAIDVTCFTKEQLEKMTDTFAYTTVTHDDEDKKLKSTTASINNSPAATTETSDSKNDKKPRMESKEVYRGAATDLPPGWTLTKEERMGGKTKGRIDRYWYSPKMQKKFRSTLEVKRFLEALQLFNGDEDVAWNAIKLMSST